MTDSPEDRVEQIDDGPEVEGHSWRPRGPMEAEQPARDAQAEDDGPDVEGHSWRPRGPVQDSED